MRKFLEAGKIINTKGLKGELKIDSYCDSPQCFEKFPCLYLDEKGEKALKILKTNVYKGFVYVYFEGINDIDSAYKLKNKILYVDRDFLDVPEGRILIDDILGVSVYNFATGEKIGVLKEVFNCGASDIYRVYDKENKLEHLIPAVDDFLESVDPENGIYIKVVDGLLNTKKDSRDEEDD